MSGAICEGKHCLELHGVHIISWPVSMQRWQNTRHFHIRGALTPSQAPFPILWTRASGPKVDLWKLEAACIKVYSLSAQIEQLTIDDVFRHLQPFFLHSWAISGILQICVSFHPITAPRATSPGLCAPKISDSTCGSP